MAKHKHHTKSGLRAGSSGVYHFTGGNAEKEEQLDALLKVLVDRPDLKQVALSRTLSSNQKAKLISPYLREKKGSLARRSEEAKQKIEEARRYQDEAAIGMREGYTEIVDIELSESNFVSADSNIARLLSGSPEMLAMLQNWQLPITERRERARQYLHDKINAEEFRDTSTEFSKLVDSVLGEVECPAAQPGLKASKALLERAEQLLDYEYGKNEIASGNTKLIDDLAASLFSSGNTKSLFDLLQNRPDLQLLMMDEGKSKDERADKIVAYLREVAATTDLSNSDNPFVQRLHAAMQEEVIGDVTLEGPAGISDDPAALKAASAAWAGKVNPVRDDDVPEEIRVQVGASTRTALDWAKIDKPVLQPNDCSRLHKLIEANTGGRVLGMPDVEHNGYARIKTKRYSKDFNGCTVFVVKHNWASLLGDSASDDIRDDSLQLPADSCAFEFRISNRNVIVIATDITGTAVFAPVVESSEDLWFVYACDTEYPAFEFAIEQARACCVMLDAQVATHEVTRAPPALNVKRAKQGKPPLRDFYTIDLSRRKRAAPPVGGYGESGKHKRLHFCRSHWRHFNVESMHPGRATLQLMCPEPKCHARVNEACRQVRIPWCLKGDPELGFVDKHYKL